jgi:hypothetical protein
MTPAEKADALRALHVSGGAPLRSTSPLPPTSTFRGSRMIDRAIKFRLSDAARTAREPVVPWVS